jgi:hypothetical protein
MENSDNPKKEGDSVLDQVIGFIGAVAVLALIVFTQISAH